MSNQQQATHAPQNEYMPWWVRFCRWLWKYPLPFLCLTLLINVAINIGSTWLITPATNAIPDASPLGRSAEWMSDHWLLTALLGTLSIALLLLTRLGSRWPTSQSIFPTRTQQKRATMIGRLSHTYEDLREQTLQGNKWMNVSLSEKPNAVQNAAKHLFRSGNQPEHLLPASTSILDVYNQAIGELLILGEPGAGKSTLLLELAQKLVERATLDAEHPLPVLLPLSSWGVKRLPLEDWIVSQLMQIYDIPPPVSEQWMREDAILPLFDGLDEMNVGARPLCIEAINKYHQVHLGVPLVVCSRKADYDSASQQHLLVLQSAVVVQQLNFQQIDAYLLQVGKRVAALRSTIKKNLTLQELATTPLMLSVLMLTYQGTSVRELPKKGVLLQQQIWTNYVARMVEQKGNKTRYPLAQTRRWLTHLALLMREQQQTIFSLDQLHPNWLPKWSKDMYHLSIRVLVILRIALVIAAFVKLSGWKPLALILTATLLGILGVIQMFRKPIDVSKSVMPKELIFWGMISEDIKNVALLGGIGWVFGGKLGPLFGLTFSETFGLLLLGPILVLLIRLVNRTHIRGVTGLGAYYILRFWLWCARLFPLHAVPFLEDATARILLRRVGGGYSFTHRLLLDYFADLDTTPPSPPIDPHVVPQSPLS